jgi:hypothetical protein
MNLDAIKSSIKKYKIATAAIVLSLLMAGAFFYRRMAMDEMQSAYDATVTEGQKLSANVTRAVQLDEQLHALEEANKTISGRLVNPLDLAINLQYFYKLEAETGVKLLDTRPVESRGAKTGAKGSYTPVQYVISLQGKYAQTLGFLRKLENGIFFCRVIGGSCGQAQSEQGKGGGDASMSLTVELLGRS